MQYRWYVVANTSILRILPEVCVDTVKQAVCTCLDVNVGLERVLKMNAPWHHA